MHEAKFPLLLNLVVFYFMVSSCSNGLFFISPTELVLFVLLTFYSYHLWWQSPNQSQIYREKKASVEGQIVLIFLLCSPPLSLVVKALKAPRLMRIRQMGLKGILLYLIGPHNWIHLAESVCYWIMFHIGWMGSNCRYYNL